MATSAKELLARKDQILGLKKKQANIEVKGVGVFLVDLPTPSDFEDAEVYYDAHKNEARNSDVVLVYRQIVEPNLKDAELVAALAEATGHENVAGPWVLDALLKPGQIARMSRIFMEEAGYDVDSACILSDEAVKELEKQMMAVEANKAGQKVKN